MECEICKAKATVHITRMENGVKREMHLCEKCAKEKFGFIFKGKIPSNNTMKGIIELMKDETYSAKVSGDAICPECGMSFLEFSETGRIGCPSCYRHFSERLMPIIQRMHRKDKHIGKVPKKYEEIHHLENTIDRCRLEMDKAVKNEEFERAAELRDEIKRLEEIQAN
ncbi:MAG TPA: UvrB/UvrC motif-containing protein [Clostridia bacterium]|nr:UvrB/UvrC motif-containing protein [Clostridia bacterium]